MARLGNTEHQETDESVVLIDQPLDFVESMRKKCMSRKERDISTIKAEALVLP